jgi:hypothetical protein
MTCRKKTLHVIGRGGKDCFHGRGNEHVGERREKFFTPIRRACQTAMALAGAVVSKPTPKNTTLFFGFSWAIFRASRGE